MPFTSAATKAPVLIVGAGPTGLVAALSLSQNRIPVRIIDKSDEYQTGTRGPGLTPRSLELLATLGVLPGILETAQLPLTRRLYNDDCTQVLKSWALQEILPPSSDVPYPNYVVNSQSSTTATIRKHLAQNNVFVELGTALETLEQDAHGVNVQLKKAATTESARFEYVFGCDGGRGVTRKLLEIPFQGIGSQSSVVVGDIVCKNVPRDHWPAFGDQKTKMLNLIPSGKTGHAFNFIITGTDFEAEKIVAEGFEAVQRVFHDMVKFEGAEVEELTWISLYRPSFRCADTFTKGRVFIGGDGAHVHSPAGGQGLNTSIQDAHNLAWKLALVLKGKARSSLLDSYDDERLPVVKTMLGISQNLHKGDARFKDDSRDRPSVSDSSTIKPDTPQEQPQQPRTKIGENQAPDKARPSLVKQLAVNYRWSSIVFDERGDAGEEAKLNAYGIEDGVSPMGAILEVRAGDRAPDASVLLADDSSESGKRNTTLLVPGIYKPTKHTALIFVSGDSRNETQMAEAVGELLRPLIEDEVFQSYIVFESDHQESVARAALTKLPVLIDDQGQARGSYGVPSDKDVTIVIVRPDQVIGAFVFRVDGVKKYIAKVFGQ